jgi:hypothetical protein
VPSLERATLTRFKCDPSLIPEIEEGLLRKFKREIHHYVTHVPEDHDFMEWLALMQHHGAPTRLLDWTYSFYVAAYFALETVRPGQSCAIWAFDREWWRKQAMAKLPADAMELLEKDPNAKRHDTVKSIIKRPEPIPLVFSLNPYRSNERLVSQQGVFVIAGDIREPFMDNLKALVDPGDSECHLWKFKVECDSPLIADALRDLHTMNINRATLFPGLDGFSRHLENLIVQPDTISTDDPTSRWATR